MKQKAIKALYESVMHHVNEGAGAGYTVEIRKFQGPWN